jgi:hypothetical protein
MAGNQRQGARKFREYWLLAKDSEVGGYQKFWIALLGDVLGVENPMERIDFQLPVPMRGTTKFLDAWIPETRVLIEHKSRGVKLDAPQTSHGGKTPYQQAVEYDNARPYGEKARWIVVCNFDEIRVHDMENPLAPPQRITLADLPKEVSRLGFLVDVAVKSVREKEKDISIKAGRIVGELYKALLKRYAEPDSPETLKALNRLCVRLVFVFYAEDADIFPKDAFWNFLNQTEAKNLRRGLLTLFRTLDTPDGSNGTKNERDPYLEPELAAFPYTNGGLFKDVSDVEIPPLDEEIRQLLMKSADFDWRGISPTIFGALFESTLNPETRRSGGMVYTSIENIHKVIDPLFLSALEKRFEEIVPNVQMLPMTNANSQSADAKAMADKLKTGNNGSRQHSLTPRQRRELLALQDEIASLTFLDPACGSGNFLTETYICLRRLENRIVNVLQQGQGEFDLGTSVKVSIAQFHGIEINDFAVAVAKTALWIAEAQMLHETAEILHREPDYLPLRDYDGIVEGNALRMDWGTLLTQRRGEAESAEAVAVEKNDARGITDSIAKGQSLDPSAANRILKFTEADKGTFAKKSFDYIMGNPPFVGTNYLSNEQREDMDFVWDGAERGKLDFVSCWYVRAAELAEKSQTRCAFVSTNSVVQGEQATSLWKRVFSHGMKIDFAHRTFRWDNESFEKAHVHCVIVGFSSTTVLSLKKTIFDEDGLARHADNINQYLLDAPSLLIEEASRPLCDVPQIVRGSQATDDGLYLFTQEERDDFLRSDPEAACYFKRFMMGREFINNIPRFCLWIPDISPKELREHGGIYERVQKVRAFRETSRNAQTRQSADCPTRFGQYRPPAKHYIAFAKVSSQRRRYIPFGFLTNDVIPGDKLFTIPNATLYHFGVLTSSVHMAWTRAVCGRLKSDYSYSTTIVYNNFPWPSSALSATLREKIETTGRGVLDVRAKYADSSLADLYDEVAMPADLRAAHTANDRAVLAAYGLAPDMPEPEIVAHLFKLYAEMTGKEDNL